MWTTVWFLAIVAFVIFLVMKFFLMMGSTENPLSLKQSQIKNILGILCLKQIPSNALTVAQKMCPKSSRLSRHHHHGSCSVVFFQDATSSPKAHFPSTVFIKVSNNWFSCIALQDLILKNSTAFLHRFSILIHNFCEAEKTILLLAPVRSVFILSLSFEFFHPCTIHKLLKLFKRAHLRWPWILDASSLELIGELLSILSTQHWLGLKPFIHAQRHSHLHVTPPSHVCSLTKLFHTGFSCNPRRITSPDGFQPWATLQSHLVPNSVWRHATTVFHWIQTWWYRDNSLRKHLQHPNTGILINYYEPYATGISY